MKNILCLLIALFIIAPCAHCNNKNYQRACTTLDSLYKYYSVANTYLFRETYPFDNQYSATYLASEDKKDIPNQYSYLWPYAGTMSAVCAIYKAKREIKYKNILDNEILYGLDKYLDTIRTPSAYASYINTAAISDRFYDDNIWIGLDFIDMYLITKEQKYIDKAVMIWKFIESGTDNQIGGGIYWCEQDKRTKNTCSNAPGAVYALKLFGATKDSTYFKQGVFLYDWTKKHLQDQTDYLYYDNISLDGKISETKYAYNSGQMMQAAALIYKMTGKAEYLEEAQKIASSCFNFFFTDFTTPSGDSFRIIKDSHNWFAAIMLRGFIELYEADNNRKYINAYIRTMDNAWHNVQSEDGLFENDRFSSKKSNKTKWLLMQGAMIEMYARIAEIE